MRYGGRHSLCGCTQWPPAMERQLAAAVVKLAGQRRQAEELVQSAPAAVRQARGYATATEQQTSGLMRDVLSEASGEFHGMHP